VGTSGSHRSGSPGFASTVRIPNERVAPERTFHSSERVRAVRHQSTVGARRHGPSVRHGCSVPGSRFGGHGSSRGYYGRRVQAGFNFCENIYATYPVYPAYPVYPVYGGTTVIVQEVPVPVPAVADHQGANADELPPVQPAQLPQEFLADQPENARGVARTDEEELYRLMVEGTEHFIAGAYNDAALKFLQVTMADPENVDATLAYALARFATGDYGTSALLIHRAIDRYPQVVDSTFDVRDRYGRMADFDRHMARLQRFLINRPDNADALLVLGFVLHFTGQREAAAEVFSDLLDEAGHHADIANVFLNAQPLDQQEELPSSEQEPAGTEYRPQITDDGDETLRTVSASYDFISIEE